jgi:hypothetical protein
MASLTIALPNAGFTEDHPPEEVPFGQLAGPKLVGEVVFEHWIRHH